MAVTDRGDGVRKSIPHAKSFIMDLKDFLQKSGHDTDSVMVMRHRPGADTLWRVLPWLAAEHHELYNAYQQVQNPDAEKALGKASLLVSMIAHQDKALFVGLYRPAGWKVITGAEFWAIPEMTALKKHGMTGMKHETAKFFELERLDDMATWKGRLVVKWPPGRLWWRWAANNSFPLHAIHEDSLLDAEMPPWDRLSLSWNQLRVLPTKWQTVLSQWRGIYLIFDRSDGKAYVGSAYGSENILGRWRDYAGSGHGNNMQLRLRSPENFLFSILQRTSPDLDRDDVLSLEANWKERLHSREYGLNEN